MINVRNILIKQSKMNKEGVIIFERLQLVKDI